MAWTDYLTGQLLYVSGVLKSPARKAWNFVGASAVFNTGTQMWDITTAGGGGGGSGDVVGPASSVVDRLALYADTTGKLLKQASFLIGDLILKNGAVAFTSDQSMGGFKLTSLGTGSAGTDAVNKSQMDTAIATAVAGAGGGGGDGFPLTFDTATADADPTAGKLRYDNATPASVTKIFVDLLDVNANDLTAWLDRLDDSVGSVKGYIRVGSISAPTKWQLFSLQSVTSAAGYRKLNVTFVAGTASLPNTSAGDTFLSFESLGLIGTIGTSSIDDDAIAFSKLLNATAAGKIIGSDAAGNFKEMGVAGGIERSGTDFIISDQLPARGSENVAIDLYPSAQGQGTVNTASSVNFDVALTSGKRYAITIDVWVDDGSGVCLFTKSLRVKCDNNGGTCTILTNAVLDDNLGAGFTLTAVIDSGTNCRFTLANTSGTNRSYNYYIGRIILDKP